MNVCVCVCGEKDDVELRISMGGDCQGEDACNGTYCLGLPVNLPQPLSITQLAFDSLLHLLPPRPLTSGPRAEKLQVILSKTHSASQMAPYSLFGPLLLTWAQRALVKSSAQYRE